MACSRQHDALYYGYKQISLGVVLVASRGQGIAAITLDVNREQAKAALEAMYPHATCIAHAGSSFPHLEQVAGYIVDPRVGPPLQLDIHGTSFQRLVWQALLRIPYGQTATYKQLAASLGRPTAVRAVASACGANHHAVVIPCHRVLGSNGSMTGYRWGIPMKAALLAHERALGGSEGPLQPKVQ
jgi:AraC family transcriptional regulator of adaptative response/methylated-DNA-[protein]-cysteine methyltransferase